MNKPNTGVSDARDGGPLDEAAGADRRRHGVARQGARRLRRDLNKSLTTWPSWFFARGDLAAGGAGDESPLVFDDTTLKAEPTHRYTYRVGRARRARPRRARRRPGPSKVYLDLHRRRSRRGRDAGGHLAQPARRHARAAAGRGAPGAAAPAPPPRRHAGAAGRGGAGPMLSTQSLRVAAAGRTSRRRWRSARAPTARAIGPDDFATTRHRVVRDRRARRRQRPRVPGRCRARQGPERGGPRDDLRRAGRLGARRRCSA